MKSIVDYLLNQDKNTIWRFPAEELMVSSQELKFQALRYARNLKAMGIQPGDRIGFILENSYDYVCLLYACWIINSVAVPLRSRSGRYHSYQSYIDKCESVCQFCAVVCEDESLFHELKNQPKFDKNITTLDRLRKDSYTAERSGNQALSITTTSITEDDIAIIQFSSGSTGDPKGVVVTHGMMMSQLQNIQDNHQRSRGEKVASSASWLPINHDMGLFIGVLSPIFSACDNLLAPPSHYMKNPPAWFALLAQYRVDFSFTTNSVLASTLGMLKRLRRQAQNDLSVLHIYIAAEKVSPTIVRKTFDTLKEFNLSEEQLHIGYGMAENALGATYTTGGPIKTGWFILGTSNGQINKVMLSHKDHPHAFELVSIGVPNDHHRITLRDKNDQILPELVLGEISIESPCVSPAYFNNPLLTEAKLGGHRLRTGDLGFKYKGEFYFYSRKDDLIITGGRNIVPDDVEAIAEELSFVRPGSTALLAYENSERGLMELHLLVEGDARLSADKVKERCAEIRQHILDNNDLLIKSISLCEKGTIEKTSSGKKRRKVILQRLQNQQLLFLPIGNTHEYPKSAIAS